MKSYLLFKHSDLSLKRPLNYTAFCLLHLNTLPFVFAHVGSMRHPALGGRGFHQVVLALQQVLVLWIVSQPAEQGFGCVIAHTCVGQTDCQGHEGLEVVGVELQTPGWNRVVGRGGVRYTSKRNLDLTDINWGRPKQRNIRWRLMISGFRMDELHLSCSDSAAVSQVCMLPSAVCIKQKLCLVIFPKLHIENLESSNYVTAYIAWMTATKIYTGFGN